jgi:hypothetical protein
MASDNEFQLSSYFLVVKEVRISVLCLSRIVENEIYELLHGTVMNRPKDSLGSLTFRAGQGLRK